MGKLLDSIVVQSDKGRAILDAASREPIGYAPIHDEAYLHRAVAAARSAQPAWAATSDKARQRLLQTIADEIEANAEELGELVSREQGKPNGMGEVHGASAWARSAAEIEIKPEVFFHDGERRSEIHYVPLGVVASIGPWNFPVMIAVWHIAPSLRMGNTVVIKPSEHTPLSVLALVELFNRHLPAGVLTAVSGGREVGAALASHEEVNKIIFTGSTATGKRIIESSANNLARLTLELGGNDPGIVLPGIDARAIGQDLFWGAFMNTGQVCAALKRLYVHDSVYDEVIAELARIAESTPMGHGADPTSKLGPLQNLQQFDIVSRLVDDARARGARVVTGGEPASELGPLFYRPTIVADIEDGAALVDEEQFGPVIPVIRYSDIDDAVRRANASEQGLGASVWAPDTETALPIAARLQAGTVWINQHGGLNPLVPFGGTKSSGYGLEFGIEGLKAVSATKVINF